MKFVGNYAESIPSSWIEHMKIHTGEIRPNPRMVVTDEVLTQRKTWDDAGYSIGDNATWELFHEWDFSEPINLNEIDFCRGKKVQWWISKVMPGHCFPMHTDTIKSELINAKRYWVAMEDYKWGHVFLLGDFAHRDYKKGDAFSFDNITHGAANVGLEPKFSLQFLVSEY